MTERFDGKPVYVSGRFEGMQKEEVWARLLATGAYGTMSRSVAKAYLSADPTDPKLIETGKPIHTLADLPASLDGFLGQMKGAVAMRRAELKGYTHCGHVAHLAYGPPADDALLARVAQALGGAPPAEVVSLMRQFNGLSCVVATLEGKDPLEVPDTVLPYAALADSAHPLWQGRLDWLIGVVAIPTWEDVFLRPQEKRLCDKSAAHDPKDVLKIGSLKVKAGELFPRLFDFDLFHHFGGAALYLDPKSHQASVVYAFDHWADLTSAQPVPLRLYLESLAAGLWGRIANVGQRPIKPVSKTARPTYVHNVHDAPYVFVELK